MKDSGDYAGVVLSGIDPVKLAEGFGVEAMHLQDEDKATETYAHALDVIERENRPFLLNVHLPWASPAVAAPRGSSAWRSGPWHNRRPSRLRSGTEGFSYQRTGWRTPAVF